MTAQAEPGMAAVGEGAAGAGRGAAKGRAAGNRGGGAAARARAGRWLVASGAAFLALIALVLLLLHLRRVHTEAAQRRALEKLQSRGIRISVTAVSTTPLERTITLPGDVFGYDQTTIYAKISGYVREIRVQRGQRVKQNDILATIESPEYEKDVLTATHDFSIAQINADRALRLAPSGVVSQQDRDNSVAQLLVARSNLARSRVILGYTTVRAPFDGTIVARYVDPGALVPAATASTTSALPIVDIANVDTLRVFVYVGQDVAPFVRAGNRATVWQDELPERRIETKVSFLAAGLDSRTRTMQVEVDLDNRRYGVLPGTFAHVDLHVDERPSPQIPDEAIVIRDRKTQVCQISAGKAHYVAVDLGYNDGADVRVLRGLYGGETVGINVPVEVGEGDPVQPVPLPDAAR